MKNQSKPKKCRVCNTQYDPYNSMQVVCSPVCAISLVEKMKQQQAKKDKIEFNRETKRRKEKLRTRTDWLKDAQKVANRYVRLRDKHKGCVSCDKPSTWGGQWHASHYRPQGNCGSLRFHWMNLNKSCSECNSHKSGNLTEYRKALVSMHGEENVLWLESQNSPYTWDIEDVKEIKKYFNNLSKEVQ